MSIFHIINLEKKIMDTGVLGFFLIKKLILDENLNLLFINLLLMIQFYIPWEGEEGYDENLK
jgi:hypothetical protein